MPYCIAKFCRNSHKNHPRKVRWHILPSKKKKHLRTHWLAKCGRPEPYDKQARVCSEHFVHPDDYSESMVRYSLGFLKEPKLNPGAVPSIFIDRFAKQDKGSQQLLLPGSTLVSDASCARNSSSSSTKRRRERYAARSKKRLLEEMLSSVIPVVGGQEMLSGPEQAVARCTEDLGLHETDNPSNIEDEARLGQSSSVMLPPDFHCKCCRQTIAVKDASMQPDMDPISEAVSKNHTYSKKLEDITDPVPPARASSKTDAVQDRKKCCDRRMKMCARTTGKYKEEVCGPKKEEEPQRQLLDAVFNLQPRFALRRADVSENLREWQQLVFHHIKEEEEREDVKCIKEEEFLHIKEEEQEEIIQVPSTGVHLKRKDEGQNEERRGAQPPNRNCSSDQDHCEGSQTDGRDDEQSEGDMTCHSSNECWKCSQCRKAFACVRNLKQHMKTRTDPTEDVVWPKPEPPHIKEEQEEEEFPPIKDRELQLSYVKEKVDDEYASNKQEKEDKEDIAKFPLNGVHLKREDESQENGGMEPPSNSSSQHMKRESDGEDHCGGSQIDEVLAPLANRDNTSDSFDDDEQSGDASMQPDMDLIIEAVSKDHTYSKKLQYITDPVPPAKTGAVQVRRKCCDRRMKMRAKTKGGRRKEVHGPKKEEEPQSQLLDAVFNLQPRIVLRRADPPRRKPRRKARRAAFAEAVIPECSASAGVASCRD
ncbi:uncharacterized protein LOC133493797 isoform X3 [Syngnathoides biaculeatus]|uniref:uncharacterized protein LOC133493797 isoform X3 n=1 Tax=Syngnathoides biaculeatus TaxID=300417 RepID=UPI002ADE3F08|nr:uncharacterized protein LOC133493797 isoform X3 [Syngnathoides biaculeatus]